MWSSIKGLLTRCGAAVALSGLVGGAYAAPIPVEHLARQPEITQVTMSAEGDMLVALMTPQGDKGEFLAVGVMDLNKPQEGWKVMPSNERMRFVSASALKGGRLFIVGQQHWTGNAGMCGLEGGTRGNTSTFVTKVYFSDKELRRTEEPLKKGGARGSEQLEFCREITTSAGVASTLPLDPDNILLRRANDDFTQTDLYRVNVRNGRATRVGEAEDGFYDSRRGIYLTRNSLERLDGVWTFKIEIRNPDTGAFEKHDKLFANADNRKSINIAGWDEEAKKFYVVTDQFSDKEQVWMYDPRTREFDNEPAFAHPKFEASGVLLGDKPGNYNKLLGFVYNGVVPTIFFVDPEMASIDKSLRNAFPGQEVSIIDYNEDLSRILFSTESAAHPPTYYVLMNKARTVKIGSERPWIDPSTLADTNLVYYDARDGLSIPAFLTLPAGWKKGDPKLPAIVLPHGGPWARDFGGWDSSGWIAFLTSRGFAVLQPQYRGSDGFGEKLWKAGDAQWGLAMQDDKDDGAKWLVSEGIAQAERIAIFGYSYGGFAAMAATVRENGPFRCAIAGAGVSNLARLGNTWSTNRVQRAFQGKTVKGMDPMDEVKKANIPILIYHGDSDVRVPLYHSTDFHAALQKEGKKSELVVIPKMQHSLPWWPDHHRKSLRAIEKFLAEDCGFNSPVTG